MGLRIVGKDVNTMIVIGIVITSDDGVITPDEVGECVSHLNILQLGESYPGSLIVLSGRAPVWLFSALVDPIVDLFPDWQQIATHDPRLGSVIVRSRDTANPVGKVLPFDLSQESLGSPGYVLYAS